MTDAAVVITEYATQGSARIVEATLNSPKSLNALTSAMIEILMRKLPVWDADQDVVAIIIKGAGERAFCAGGDIRDLYAAMAHENQHFGQQFFNLEYSLDMMLHNLNTPLLVWGNGYVMGGGMGIYQAADIRVVTPSSRLAMPEISIGLYPDVGASLFLQKVPHKLGLFLGLTGAMVNATDACRLQLADVQLAEQSYASLVAGLQQWHSATERDFRGFMQTVVADLSNTNTEAPESDIDELWDDLVVTMNAGDLLAIYHGLNDMQGRSKWLDKAINTMRKGSPTSLHLAYRQLQQPVASWYDAFMQEYYIAVNATKLGEFQEGIRALLIDKDGTPAWRYASIAEVPAKWIDRFYDQQAIVLPDYA